MNILGLVLGTVLRGSSDILSRGLVSVFHNKLSAIDYEQGIRKLKLFLPILCLL